MKVKGPPSPVTSAAPRAQTAAVDAPPEAALAEKAAPKSASFAGTSSQKLDRPLQKHAGSTSPLGAMFGAPKDPKLAAVLGHILPPGSTGADLSKVTTVAQALALATGGELMGLIRDRFTKLQAQSAAGPREKLALGVQMVDIGRLVPGQTRISIQRVREKVAKQVQFDGFVVDHTGAKPAFADGQATVPLAVPKPAVAGPGGQVLVIDGNHQAVASILAGASQTPVDIVADHQDLSPEAFAALAAEQGWTYLKAFGGADAVRAPDYADLVDDPVRFVMTETALKASLQDGAVEYEDKSRLDTRVWVKLAGTTVEFVEFILADAIYARSQQDPALAARLHDDDIAVRAGAAREALAAAVRAGGLDPDQLGILLLEQPAADLGAISDAARARLT